ncbi:MAG TPA: alpha/beta hydrolase [Microscillaceae bacterium]|jgi:predicted alpha/beta-fold hydrolase|nr:alpha/beta hydrolase [Microscillaceae bacterium]
MPVVQNTDFFANPWHINRHGQTIIPSQFRKIRLPKAYQRQRIETPDGDFLDLDWLRHSPQKPQQQLVIISHGLEGNTSRQYVVGMARLFYEQGWDVLAWNFRSCSGEPNRLPHFYHAGFTKDLSWVIDQVIALAHYQSIALVGFSMGGNMTLKYLGEKSTQVPAVIQKAVVFSVPCDLVAGAAAISHPNNWIYSYNFLRKLRKKIKAKAAQLKSLVDVSLIDKIKTLEGFDDAYTAPLHGFANAQDYYTQSGALPLIPQISIPTLMVNALNDPFLAGGCFPTEVAAKLPHFYLETPAQGGHCGFSPRKKRGGFYWSEWRALAFVQASLELGSS